MYFYWCQYVFYLAVKVRNSNFSAFIDVFTANTYVMVIVSDSQIPSEAIMINIRYNNGDFSNDTHKMFSSQRNARKHFEKLERDAQGSRSMQVTEKG